MRLQTVNPSLQRIAVDYLAQHFGNPAQTLTTRVRHLLHRTLGTAQSDKRAIAAMLGLHPRTLQRYLEVEGTRFDALRDDVQRQLAPTYPCEPRIRMPRIAGLPGYADGP